MLMLSSIIMPNVVKYMQVLLKVPLPSRIYKQPLDTPNLIYTVALIRKTWVKDLVLVVLSASTVSNILKIMIFVDLIDKATEMVKYLQSNPFKRIKTLRGPLEIIQAFSANLNAKSKARFLYDLCSKKIRVLVFNKCAGLGINFCNIF